jgi:hypothetical protein
MELLNRHGITFTPPDGWTVEDAEDKGAVYLMTPEIDGGIDAAILVELPRVADTRPIEKHLRAMSESLRAKHDDYRERGLRMHSEPGHVTYGMLEYAVTKKRVPLVEQHVLVPMTAERTVLVFTSTSRRTASKYLPVFKRFISSLRVPQ